MLEQAGALRNEGLEAIQQWGEGTITQAELVDIADRIYLDYFDLGEELAELNPPPVGFERPTELLLEAVGQLFQGYGNAWRALDSREMDDAQLQEANTYLNEGGALLGQTAEAVLESEIDAACAEALPRTVDTLD